MGMLSRAVAQVEESRSVSSAAKPAAWLLDALGGGVDEVRDTCLGEDRGPDEHGVCVRPHHLRGRR